MSTLPLRVECALIHTIGPTVLTPSVAIEEVFVDQGISAVAPPQMDAKTVAWRGNNIPLLTLGDKGNERQTHAIKRIIVILRHPLTPQGFRHLGLIATQVPQMIQVHSHNLASDVNPPVLYPYTMSYARLDDEPVIILDVDYLLTSARS